MNQEGTLPDKGCQVNSSSTTACPERLRLSESVATAVQDVYTAKVARDRVVAAQGDSTPYAIALKCAREQERLSVAMLDQHRKQHGC